MTDNESFSLSRSLKARFLRQHPILIALEYTRIIASGMALLTCYSFVDGISQSDSFPAIMHRRIFRSHQDAYFGPFYKMVVFSTGVMFAWIFFGILRNFVRITLARMDRSPKPKTGMLPEKRDLPPWNFRPESFCILLGEQQARDGSRVPNAGAPKALPDWVLLTEEALFTGVFTTGGVGTGKTQATVYQALPQLLACQRDIPVLNPDGTVGTAPYRFSGLVLDEKGDVCSFTRKLMKAEGREDDFIEISPTGSVYWNPIYNPNLPAWANAYVLFKILAKFNKGSKASDPFWETSPKEQTIDLLQLLDDAYGYYTITDYLALLADDETKAVLVARALERHSSDRQRCAEIQKRWAQIVARDEEMSDGLRSSLKAVARAGLKQFEFLEIRKMFSPPPDVYFHGPSCPWPRRVAKPGDEKEAALLENEENYGIKIPKANVFTGFDQILDRGKVVAINMPKSMYQDAAEFIQVAAKFAWQQAVQRRGSIKPDSTEYYLEPRFGHQIGYCPTFLIADECQNILDPDDKDFLDKCRSQKASVWLTTQSHSSIFAAFGEQKKGDAKVIIQNCMTRIYYRQSDPDSIKLIEGEVDKAERYRTSMSITEGGQGSQMDYLQGGIVDEGKAVAETKTVSSEEKPFFESDHLRALKKYQSVVLVSNGDTTLPARILFGRPYWMFPFGRPKDHKLPLTLPYYDWPEQYTAALTDKKWVAPTAPVTLNEGQTVVGGFQTIRVLGDARPPEQTKTSKVHVVPLEEDEYSQEGGEKKPRKAKAKARPKEPEQTRGEDERLLTEVPLDLLRSEHERIRPVGEEVVAKLLKEEKANHDLADQSAKEGKGKSPKPLPKRLSLADGDELEFLP